MVRSLVRGRLLLTMLARPVLEAVAFTDAGCTVFPHRLLNPDEVRGPAHALLWELSAQRRLPRRLKLDAGLEFESLARAMSINGSRCNGATPPAAPRAAPRLRGRRSILTAPG